MKSYSNVVKTGGHLFFKWKLSPWQFRYFKEYHLLSCVPTISVRVIGRTEPGKSIDTTESEPRYRFLNAVKFASPEAAAIESDLWRLTLREVFNIPVLEWSCGSFSALRTACRVSADAGPNSLWFPEDLGAWAADETNWSRELADFIKREELCLDRYKTAFADYGEARKAIFNANKFEDSALLKWGEKRRIAEEFRILVQREGLENWRMLFSPEVPALVKGISDCLVDATFEVEHQVQTFLGAVEGVGIQLQAAAEAFKILETRFDSEMILLDNCRPTGDATV